MRSLATKELTRVSGGVTYAEDVTATMTTVALGTVLSHAGVKLAEYINQSVGWVGPKASSDQIFYGQILHYLGRTTPLWIGAYIFYQHPDLYDSAKKRLGAYF